MPTPYRYLRCGDLRSSGVTRRRDGPLGLRDDDDDDDDGNDDDDNMISWDTESLNRLIIKSACDVDVV